MEAVYVAPEGGPIPAVTEVTERVLAAGGRGLRPGPGGHRAGRLDGDSAAAPGRGRLGSPPLSTTLAGTLVVVCADLRDPGNLGTVIRTADAVRRRRGDLLRRHGRPDQSQVRARHRRLALPCPRGGRGLGPRRGGRPGGPGVRHGGHVGAGRRRLRGVRLGSAGGPGPRQRGRWSRRTGGRGARRRGDHPDGRPGGVAQRERVGGRPLLRGAAPTTCRPLAGRSAGCHLPGSTMPGMDHAPADAQSRGRGPG